jgi:hypothetical protein
MGKEEFEKAGEAVKVFKRCGKERDCQLKIGTLLTAQVVVTGAITAAEDSARLDLVVLDTGSKTEKLKAHKTLGGTRVQRAAMLEALLTQALFPERMVGAISITLDPPDAQVWLDGRLKIDHPAGRLDLPRVLQGQHTLRVARAGFADFFAVVQVPFQGTTDLEVKMRSAASAPETVPLAEPESPEARVTSTWWIWTIVGVVLIGGVTTTVLLVR